MKKNNKIALCISGQPRNVEEAYRDNIRKNLIEPNNITDIFVHCWWDWEWIFPDMLPKYENRPLPLGIEKYSKAHVHYLYDPLVMRVESTRSYKEFVEEFYVHDPNFKGREKYNIRNAFFKYLSVYKANEIKNEFERDVLGKEYDIVVKMRFDARFEKPIILEDLDLDNYIYVPTMSLLEPDLKKLNRTVAWNYLPKMEDWRVRNEADIDEINKQLDEPVGLMHYRNFRTGVWDYPAINDTFAVGNKKNMDVYCSVINHLKWMGEKHPTAVAEGTMGRWLKENDIKVYANWVDIKEVGVHRQKYANHGTVTLSPSYKEVKRDLPERKILYPSKGENDIDGRGYVRGVARLKTK